MVAQDGQFVLADAVLGDLVAEMETIHARALVRRKRRLVGHARIAAERAGLVALELPGDLLLVSAPWQMAQPASRSRAASSTSRRARHGPRICTRRRRRGPGLAGLAPREFSFTR